MLLLVYILVYIDCCLAQSSSSGDSSSWFPWLILAVALAIAIVLISLATFYVLNICKKIVQRSNHRYPDHLISSKEGKDGDTSKETSAIPFASSDAGLHDDSQVLEFGESSPAEIPREQIKILQQLGIGEFGPIHDAEVQLNVNVKSRALVKVFQRGTTQDLVSFTKELEKLMKLNHSKVGQLFGVVSHRPYYCVLELPVNGDLKTFLITTKTSNIELSLAQLMGLATDVASGLSYLESMQYIHRDVAARNCMVTQNLGVKITDYKVGRFLFRSEYAVQADGALLPIRWMAPESLLENHYSLQGDVWSFGVLMWEILTRGEYPYTELADSEVIHGICYEFQRLLQPVDCTEKIYQLMLLCWHSNPEQRPRMEYLHQQLETTIIKTN